jgi:hypothetical protein
MSNFSCAIKDYRYLKERGYPEKASLKMVGDRHRLSRLQRNCLFRGIVAGEAAVKRRSKIVEPESVRNEALGIDWYNVIISVESYLKGLPVFISDDGFLRDATGVHGSYRVSGVTRKAVETVLEGIKGLAPGRLDIYLDAPVSFSGDTAAELRDRVRDFGTATVSVAPSPDFILKTYQGFVASSDSIIIEKAERIVDLARYVLLSSFGFRPPELNILEL